MEYSKEYLNRQLAIARKVKKDVAATLAVTPNDTIASICKVAVDNRMVMLRTFKAAPKEKVLEVVRKPVSRVRLAKTTVARTSGVVAKTTPKYRNTDHRLDSIVEKRDGNLFICNLNLLWS